jgi:ASC-1-like (ASCH) protein
MEMESEHLSEPWFSLISLGLKTVEGRLNAGLYQTIQVGDTLSFYNDDFSFKRFLTLQVIEKRLYSSFMEYLETEGLETCLPSIEDLNFGVLVYRKYYSVLEEKDKGVVAIKIKVIKRFNL